MSHKNMVIIENIVFLILKAATYEHWIGFIHTDIAVLMTL